MRKLIYLAAICAAFALFPAQSGQANPPQGNTQCKCQTHTDHDHLPTWATLRALRKAGAHWNENLGTMIQEFRQCQVKLVYLGDGQVQVARAGGGFVIVVLDGAL